MLSVSLLNVSLIACFTFHIWVVHHDVGSMAYRFLYSLRTLSPQQLVSWLFNLKQQQDVVGDQEVQSAGLDQPLQRT